ncbi:MAG: LCP family protein [Firmicutes bacterium]|mgnify:CR=1 FL=1|nr:LCP family protein [Bacillota bacterium]
MLTPEELELKRQELQEKRRQKRERRRLRRIYYGLMIILAILLVVGTAYYTYHKGVRFSYSTQTGDGSSGFDVDKGSQASLEPVNILVLGIDERPDDPGRTDTMILASIDQAKGRVSLISLPRDTRVRIPGRRGYEKLNSAHAYGGPRLAMSTVSKFLGVPVKYYVKVDFNGFEQLVDILGGVEIDVERRMKYDDYAQNLHINLYPGLQVLNGADALAYVRYRADGLGDVALVDPAKGEYGGRILRQQKFINALVHQVLQPSVITKLPSLFLQLRDCVTTNMPVTQMLSLGLGVRDFTSDSVITALLPGIGETINGASYWILNEDATQVLVDQLVRGIEPVTIQVLNGSGAAGAAGYAAERLRERGYQVIDVRDAQSFGYRETEVIVKPARRDVGAQIAQIFDAKIIDGEDAGTVAWGDGRYDVMVIVGENFSVPQF